MNLIRQSQSVNSLKAELSAAENALSLVKDGYRKEDIEAAEAQVEVCQARFQAANNALSDTKLYAPSDGTILTRVSEPGTIVNAGQGRICPCSLQTCSGASLCFRTSAWQGQDGHEGKNYN